MEGNIECREGRIGQNDEDDLETIVQVGNDRDLIKAMALGMTRKGRMPNILVVETIGLVTH